MIRQFARVRRVVLPLSCGLLVAALASCGSVGGGGGVGGSGVAVVNVGGTPNSPCTQTYYNEGCFIPSAGVSQRVTCTPAAAGNPQGSWVLTQECGPGTTCVQSADPAAANKKVTACTATPVNNPIDTVSGQDIVTGNDTQTGTDTNNDATVAKDGSETPDITIVTDTGGGGMLTCIKEKCADSWATCKANSQCESVTMCIVGCGANPDCPQSCFNAATESVKPLLIGVLSCGTEQGCLAGANDPVCGDGACNGTETKSSCAQDCGAATKCGDGLCNGTETKSTCAQDCSVPPKCGDGLCNGTETKTSCAKDCGTATSCGDGVCNGTETKSSCAKDCGTATNCGDGTCSSSETKVSCPDDCDPTYKCFIDNCSAELQACQSNAACKNLGPCVSACAGNQTCISKCAATAGSAAVQIYNAQGNCYKSAGCDGGAGSCGDGTCSPSENPVSCESDCDANDCITTNCSTETDACGADAGCQKMFTCFSGCASDNVCSQNCFNSASPGAQQLYGDIAQCAIDNQCIAPN